MTYLERSRELGAKASSPRTPSATATNTTEMTEPINAALEAKGIGVRRD